MKARISRFLQGVTGAISGLRPASRSGRKTVKRKTASSGKRPLGRTRTKGKQRHQRVGSSTVRKRHLRGEMKPIEPMTDDPKQSSPSQTVIYSCPACGLQAPKTLMFEHLIGSPTHQLGRVEPEQAADHRLKENPGKVGQEDPSKDSLRNLLQILLPPRAFGRRHEQKNENLPPK